MLSPQRIPQSVDIPLIVDTFVSNLNAYLFWELEMVKFSNCVPSRIVEMSLSIGPKLPRPARVLDPHPHHGSHPTTKTHSKRPLLLPLLYSKDTNLLRSFRSWSWLTCVRLRLPHLPFVIFSPSSLHLPPTQCGSLFPVPHSLNWFMLTSSYRIRTLAFSPTGALLATGSADRTLRIWNPEKPSAKYSTELRGHTGGIERVAWNPVKDAELASVSSDGTCRFWDVRSKACRAVVQLGGEGLTVTWSADGGTVVVGRKVGDRAFFYFYRLYSCYVRC